MKRLCRIGILSLAVLLLLAAMAQAQVVDRSSMTNKVLAGYQGWHACPGDGNVPGIGWTHWADDSSWIGPGNYHTEIWPDVAEYPLSELFFVPNTNLTQGGTPYLFSSTRQGAVNVHFRWMQENLIDGALHQRFVGGYVGNPNDGGQWKLDRVLQNVMNAANTYGRVWALEYDTSGVSDADLYNKLTGDWTYLKNAFNIKNHSRYLYHNGKPVVILWGFGFQDRPGTPQSTIDIINWFKNDGCFVIGGVPAGWRTLTWGSKTDPAWAAAYRSFNGISPWTVGAYNDWNGINGWKTEFIQPDLAECNSLGIAYLPVAWPRFGWDNMHDYPCGQSDIGSRGGQHFWDQIYAWKSAGVTCQKIAMFDEYDEGTAIMKCTDNVPTSGCWFNTEGKGTDWYLRLTNQAGKMHRGEIAVSQTIPINSATSPDNAQIIGNTIPSTMAPGQNYSVSITVQNTGETCWTQELFKLGAIGDTDPFYGSSRVMMGAGETVMPGAQKPFTFTMTAPTTPGLYTTDWQMVHDVVRWFGGTLVKQVNVANVYCFEDLFSYSNGNLNGNGGWSGSAGSEIAVSNQTVQVNGGTGVKDAIKTVSCGDPGSGYITVRAKIKSGAGVDTSWSLYIDDAAGLNLARWYGSGTTARGRIGGTADVTATQTLSGGWDDLKVKIVPSANTSEFFFNGISLGVLSHSSQGAGDVVGRLRFERSDNSAAAGQYVYFDDLRIGEIDTTPPGPVTNFIPTRGDMQNSLTWTNPGSDYAGTMIRFSTITYPGSPTGGSLLYQGSGTSTTHSGLTNGVTYYYSAFAYDTVPNYSGAAIGSATPADTTAPGPVTGFAATPGDTQCVCNWTNPTGDYTGTIVRMKTTGYPTGPTDGDLCYQGTGTGHTHTGLTNGVTYYYCAYAYDEVPNYAAAAQTSATPSGAPEFCFRDEFNYANGALVGLGGWTGTALVSHIEVIDSKVRVWGGSQAKNAVKTMTCSGAPYIWVRLLAYAGTGTSTMWNVWINDSGGKNFARWYGAGTTARGRIGTSGTVTAVQTLRGGGLWDSLVVKIDPAANTTQFYFNGADLGVYSHGTQPNSVVSEIKIERENNGGAAGHYMFLDDIRVSQT